MVVRNNHQTMMDSQTLEYQFLWFVENYSYCWHKNGEHLLSPEFIVDGLEATRWMLELYPRGGFKGHEGYVSLYLRRSAMDIGPEDFTVKYNLAFLKADGIVAHSKSAKSSFKQKDSYGWPELAVVLQLENEDVLKEDTLCVSCKIWIGEGKIQKINETVARTRIGIEKMSFFHVTENFGTLEPNEKRTTEVRFALKSISNLSNCLYVTDDSNDAKIMFEVKPPSTKSILHKRKLYLIDAIGEKIDCGEVDSRFDVTRKEIQNWPLSLKRKEILEKKSDYLPEDKLTLLCECTFSTGVEYEKIESIRDEKPLVASYRVVNGARENNVYNASQKLSASASVVDDLKLIYENHKLTDVVLKTNTKSFPAHKLWLCTRSRVFEVMLTTDMKEKNNNCIEVDDLEDDTVQQFLYFLYTDKLENLQWESALKLYYAGDKYEIERLKVMCTSFLIANVTTSSAAELLHLADTHNDFYLKNAVEDFILKHDEQVFGSGEWEKLTETHPQLASKTMLLKYKKN